jgi:FeS assembly SUF system protein
VWTPWKQQDPPRFAQEQNKEMDATQPDSVFEKAEVTAEPTSESRPATPAPVNPDILRERIINMMRTIYDPEIPVNIYEIGLIYSIDIDSSNAVNIRMTLTSPACPAAGTLPGEVEDKARRVESVTDVKVDVVWDPTWSPAMMSETAKLQLGML